MQVGAAKVSLYTGSANVPVGVAFLSDPVFFGPSGISFPEPGVTMHFLADPVSLVLPSDMQMLTYKVRIEHLCSSR
jgi:hypothetical protein